MNGKEYDKFERRAFLKKAAGAAGGILVVAYTSKLALLFGAEEESSDTQPDKPNNVNVKNEKDLPYDPTNHAYFYLIDVSKCIGCGSCVRACAQENNVPQGFNRTWIERYHVAEDGHVDIDSPNGGNDGFKPRASKEKKAVKAFFVPKLCNHCVNTPCTQVCPVGASYSTPDHVVLVDQKQCIGCGYCVQACPFGSRFMDPHTHTATKCSFCYHRITKGLLPACVEACPQTVRMFGDKKKLGDKVTQIIRSRNVRVLKPELHTVPNCYYLNAGMEVI